MLGVGGIFVVLIIVLVLILVGTSTKKQQLGATGPAAATASLVAKVSGVPETVFTKVGLPSVISNPPKKVTGHGALTANGKPEVLYVGAEYCPFCAAERWAMVMALAKFGTFSNLHTTYSSVSDFAPDTATFTFHGSTYTSQYIEFRPVEVATNLQAATGATCQVNGYACLDTPTSSEDSLFQSVGGGSFPFVDFGNKAVQSGAGFENQPLALQGYNANEIATFLYQPTSAIAQAEDGSANYMVGAICAITDDQPSSVCDAPYVKPAQKKAGVT
jgi:hypothetical protein